MKKSKYKKEEGTHRYDRSKEYTRHDSLTLVFMKIWGWLCGCEEKNAQIDSAYKLSIVKHNKEEEKKQKCVVPNHELG